MTQPDQRPTTDIATLAAQTLSGKHQPSEAEIKQLAQAALGETQKKGQRMPRSRTGRTEHVNGPTVEKIVPDTTG